MTFKKNVDNESSAMLGSLVNSIKRDPMWFVLVVAALALAAFAGLRLYRTMKKKEKFSDDTKCRKDGSTVLRCPQDNLYKAGFNCLHYDGARCCKQNWFGDGSSSNPGYCKAMDMKNITTDWNIPRFWDDHNFTGAVITSRTVYGSTVTGGWKNMPDGWKNRVSSIKVPNGYKVELASKDDGDGKIITIGPGTSVNSLSNCKYHTGDESLCGHFAACDASNNTCWNNSVNSIRVSAV